MVVAVDQPDHAHKQQVVPQYKAQQQPLHAQGVAKQQRQQQRRTVAEEKYAHDRPVVLHAGEEHRRNPDRRHGTQSHHEQQPVQHRLFWKK
jgi:hypothetical protein